MRERMKSSPQARLRNLWDRVSERWSATSYNERLDTPDGPPRKLWPRPPGRAFWRGFNERLDRPSRRG
jgi:hypothetical protein